MTLSGALRTHLRVPATRAPRVAHPLRSHSREASHHAPPTACRVVRCRL